MTNVIIYFAFAISVACMALYIRQVRADFALYVTLAAGAVILSGVVPGLSLLINDIRSFSSFSGIDEEYIVSIMKIIGITYLAEFSADICIDAGERALASHVETIGKISVAFIALPIAEDVFSLIINLLE